jgi:DNA-binding Lrp family transcriptional regulator
MMFGMSPQMSNLDAVDRSLVVALQSDARQTNRALASRVGVAPSTSLERVRDLERRGVVTGYGAEVDLTALGRPVQAMVAVRFRPKTNEVTTRFVEAMWELPQVLSVTLLTGVDDALVHLAVSSVEELRTLVLDRVARAPGVVDERTSLVFEHRRRRVVEPA